MARTVLPIGPKREHQNKQNVRLGPYGVGGEAIRKREPPNRRKAFYLEKGPLAREESCPRTILDHPLLMARTYSGFAKFHWQGSISEARNLFPARP